MGGGGAEEGGDLGVLGEVEFEDVFDALGFQGLRAGELLRGQHQAG